MIEGIGLTDARNSVASAQSGQQLDKNAFTQLLVTQLQNQDPLSPQSNEELAAQLAQFSSLEQMELVNENLVGMARLDQNNALASQITGASALVGQRVSYTDEETGGPITGDVEYAKVSDGLVYLGVDGIDVPLARITEVLGQAPEQTVDPEDPSEGAEDSTQNTEGGTPGDAE